MPLGKNLAILRKRKELTLDGLADLSGVDRAVIWALEDRDSRKSKYVGQLARGLGVSRDVLEADAEPPETIPGEAPEAVRAADPEAPATLRGELGAVQIALLALIGTHPDKRALLTAFDATVAGARMLVAPGDELAVAFEQGLRRFRAEMARRSD